MKYLLIPLMCILASSKVTLQSRFSKTKNSGIADNLFFNGMMFLAVAVMFTPFIIKNGVEPDALISGIIMGVFSVVFQVFYICAFTAGKMSLTVVINNFSMIIPIFVSFLIFNEPFGISKILGTVLVLISFCLTVAKEENDSGKKGYNKAWLIYVSLVFLSNGIAAVSQKVYTATTDNLQVFEYVGISYITAAAISFAVRNIILLKSKMPAVKPEKNVALSACAVGVLLGVFQCVNTYATSVIDGTLLFSAFNCATSLLITVIGRLIFSEKLTQKQFIGVMIGIAAIVFICI